MHSSHPNGMFVRSSNSPVGSREQTRGQSDYSTWKNRQREEYVDPATAYGAMEVDYPPANNAVKNPAYAQYPPGNPAGYPAQPYPPQPPIGANVQYPGQAYPYGANPPTQYSPGPPQAPQDMYGIAGPPAMAPGFNQEAYVRGSNFQQVTQGYAPPAATRMTPISVSSGAGSRSLYAPSGTPVYGTDAADPYYSSAAGASTQIDPRYGRGAYNMTATTQPPASSDDLGSPAGTAPAPRPGAYPGSAEPVPDEMDTFIPTSTSSTPSQIAPTGPSGPRRDRDSEPRDHREHRPRRSEQQDRDERYGADRGGKHRHGHR